jgi:hypothetical protein
MSNYENITFTRKSHTFAEIENKKNHTIRQLEKEMERRNRKPSNRLGKNAKKQKARRNLVLKDEETEEEVEEEEFSLVIKPSRIPLGRLKRKPGHRERRPDTIEFNEVNPLDFHPDPFAPQHLMKFLNK